MDRPDRPRPAGPGWLARRTDGRAVDGLDVELGRARFGRPGDLDRLADERLEGIVVAPVPRRTGRQLPGLPRRRDGEGRTTLAVSPLRDRPFDRHVDLGSLGLGRLLRLLLR